MTSATHHLADFALRTRATDLPANVRQESLRAFLNWVGCAVGGSNTPTVAAAVRGLQTLGRAPAASLLGRAERLDAVDAAVVNCVSSSAHTFDDTHLKTITHPTGPVAAALLALSQMLRVSGTDLLAALAIGIEIECRLASVIVASGSAHKGWYMTGLAGGVGAAAAVARVLGLDHEQTTSALGLAAAQASGLRATHGSMAIAYVPAVAAQQGLLCAHLARGGFRCSDIAIDGRNGLFEVVAAGASADDLCAGLGDTFELMNNAYKPYPCGIVIHPSIDACLEIAARPMFSAERIERIDLEVHADALALCWRRLPATELEAQVSLYHWVAAALTHRAATIEQGETVCVQDPRVRELQERIFVRVSPALAGDQASVVVHMRDGGPLRADVDHAIGSIARPMTDRELDRKFLTLARRALSVDRAAELLRACRSLPSFGDASRVAALGAGA